MNSKAAAVLFMLVATVANMLVTGIVFIALLVLWGLVFAPLVRLNASVFVIIGAFVLAAVIDTMIYRAALALMRKKINFEKTFGIKV